MPLCGRPVLVALIAGAEFPLQIAQEKWTDVTVVDSALLSLRERVHGPTKPRPLASFESASKFDCH